MSKRAIIQKTTGFAVFFLLFLSCGQQKDMTLARRMAELDNPDVPLTEARITEYQNRIEALEKDAESVIKSVQDQGGLYELLGMKYIDYGMYGPAYDSFTGALEIFPEKPALHYYRAVCAGNLAQAQDNPSARADYLGRAEAGYKRSIELDERYPYSWYGLAVLYVYEMDRPEEAVPYLEKFLTIEKSNVKAMYLLAGLYENYPVGKYEERMNRASELYEDILDISKDDELRTAAKEKLDTLSGKE